MPTREEDDFEVRPEVLERHITPRSKVLVLVTPNNPSGNVLPRALLERLAEIARRHDLTVVSDEMYEKFIYDSAPVPALRPDDEVWAQQFIPRRA